MLEHHASTRLDPSVDPTTQSNYLQIVSKSVEFYWVVDFDNQIIKGSATHNLRVQAQQVSKVV
jgi:leukotriene-A4 hydrolase